MHRIGVLIIHGIFGSPHEFKIMQSILNSQGFFTHAVSLPGHGDQPESKLIHVTGESMLAHCRKEYDLMASQCDQVFILGHSLGGILSLLTASKNPPKLNGVITFATPYEHAYFVNYFYGFLVFPLKHLFPGLRYAPEYLTGNKSPVFLPSWFPALYREATGLLKKLQAALANITVPVQLAHSPHDMVIPFSEMQKIAKGINQPDRVRLHVFQNCGHQVFPNSREEAMGVKLVLEFIARHAVVQESNDLGVIGSI
ncbi:MAG: alpha/beta fold hydrolase [Cyanobacteria bacterium]|nr:alpha/beta fold hydrolase [Cyanobacteriota bacterium]